MTDTLDKLFDAEAAHRWKDLKGDALLDFQFTASDPESLEGVTDHPPPDSEPEVEYRYNMTGRGEMVRCVYCRHPNHYHGIVVRYPDGSRRLVGRDCALTHHGVEFERGLVEFEAAIERQSYARRRRALIQASAQVFREFSELRQHPAVEAHDKTLWQWRNLLHELAAAVANVARRDERLTIDRQVRDVEAEMDRRARLGDRFEEERQKAKAAGKTWQLYKHVPEEVGPLDGAVFFTVGVRVRNRLEELQGSIQKTFQMLSGEDLKTHQIRSGLNKLGDLRDALAHELDRLDALMDAFSPENLSRIARWANEQAADQVRREAALANVKCPPISNRFTVSGRSITDRQGSDRFGRQTASLPDAYYAPKRTIIETLKEATSAEHEP